MSHFLGILLGFDVGSDKADISDKWGIHTMTIKISQVTGFGIGVCIFGCTAMAGPDWIEDGDAGSSIGGAQDTTSVGLLNTIAGTLGGADQEDIYRLIIEDANDIASPVDFGLLPGSDPEFNPALWLFDSEGFGVLGNDDDPILGGPGARLITPSTDGVTLLLPPGIYYLAVTESGNVPLSFVDGFPREGKGSFEEIFMFNDLLEVSGPDGLGADYALADWSGGAGTLGTYGINITPTPSTVGLFSIFSLGICRRRR